MLTKITGYGPVKKAGEAKKSGRITAASSFADLLSAGEVEDAAALGSLQDVSAAAAISNMLSLQEISEEDVRRKKLMQQGKNMIDELEALRRQLLAGGIAVQTLQNLARQVSIQKQQVTDPKLAAIIDDIELRVAVELAKLERAAGGA